MSVSTLPSYPLIASSGFFFRDVTPVGRNMAAEINGSQRSPGKD
jgi:hypothetical protein